MLELLNIKYININTLHTPHCSVLAFLAMINGAAAAGPKDTADNV